MNRTKIFPVRFTLSEWADITAAAQEADVTASEWIRRRVLAPETRALPAGIDRFQILPPRRRGRPRKSRPASEA